jgi:hypothetical protein
MQFGEREANEMLCNYFVKRINKTMPVVRAA